MVDAIGAETLKAIALAGPEMQVNFNLNDECMCAEAIKGVISFKKFSLFFLI